MSKRDHVQKLVHTIKQNGGLMERIYTLGDEVIEGSSRLAAYKILAEKYPDPKWEQIIVKELPANTTDTQIFAFLHKLHVAGKTSWKPFEKAGMFYREAKKGKTAKQIAKDIKENWTQRKRLKTILPRIRFSGNYGG